MDLTDRFSDALIFAASLHRAQRRKGTDIPYIAHLLAVSAVVLDWGGAEDVAIAGLLHDAVEDQGGLDVAEAIRARFGDVVTEIVLACSDSTSSAGDKAPWRERKEAYLNKLSSAGPAVALVTAADKLNNLGALIRDVERDGIRTLERFTPSPTEMVWYYDAVLQALFKHRSGLPWKELSTKAEEFGALVEGGGRVHRTPKPGL